MGVKNLIDRNRIKKFMQVGVDVTYMYINFGGHDLYGFGDTATFKNGQISFRTMDYSPWGQKIQSIGIGSKNLCK